MANENLSLIKHQLERFGVVTVMDVTMYDFNTNEPVLELDTLKISNITTGGQSKNITGGLLADMLLQFDYSRTVEVEIQDALISMYSLQRIWGATLNSGKVDAHEKIALANATGKLAAADTIGFDTNVVDPTIDLREKHYQLRPNSIKMYNASTGALLKATTDYSVTTGAEGYVSSIAMVTAVTGEALLYAINVVETEKNANGYVPAEIVLKSTSFPKVVKLVGKTVYIEQSTGKEVLAEIEIPKFKMGSSFTFSMDGEGAASVFDASGSALVDGKKDLIKIKTLQYVSGILS